MITHPSADELLSAVSDFIERVAPDLKDRDVFLARVAVNALATVRRELQAGQEAEAAATGRLASLLDRGGSFIELNAALGEAIRAGEFDEDDSDLLMHLKASAIDRLRIDQPGYSGLKAALEAKP